MLNPQIFTTFMLISTLYHILGGADFTTEDPLSQTLVPGSIGDEDVIVPTSVVGEEGAAVHGPMDNKTANETGPTELPVYWEFTLSLMVQAYAGIIIVLLGFFGNILVLMVYSRKSGSSTNIYLINLAAADLTVTLIGQLSRVFPRALTGFDTGSYHPVICKLWFFINHSAKTISGWTLVAVTVERTLVVYLPLRARNICTTKRAKMAIIAINFLCMACYLHYFWTYGDVWETTGNVTRKVAGCTIVQDNPDIIPYMTYVRPWQDLIIRSAGPFFCLLICNCLIIAKLIQMSVQRAKMAQGQEQTNEMKSMTAMLLTVSFAFLILISPMQIMYLIDKSDPFGWIMDERWKALVALRWSFAIDMYYLNHAVNFILYCISGKTFRNELTAMMSTWPVFKHCCKIETKYTSKDTSVASVTTVSEKTKGSNLSVNEKV